MAMPGTETIRFRRPIDKNAPKPEPKLDQFGSMAPQGWKRRHQGLLQDQLRRQSQGPLVPTLSVAFRLLMLIRAMGALYATIADCDEVFNFYEPLHFFHHNSGFQTWELSPEFGIRSWAYVLLYYPFAYGLPTLFRLSKRGEFFALRMTLAVISSFCEAKFYRAVVEAVNERVGRYTLFIMFFSAGMYNAGISFLPSSFTMYTTMLGFSYALHPATSTATGKSRAFKATLCFAVGALVWPFSALLAVPFVVEQLFVNGDDTAAGDARIQLLQTRWATLLRAASVGFLAVPVFLVDSWAYGRWTFPSLNIITYNLFSAGPQLYGTEPPTFYLANMFVNFNFITPFALVALPGLYITYRFDNRRLGRNQRSPLPTESSPYTLLALRLAPFYLWLAVFTLQPHKEERFLVPAYPLLALNAAVGIYLVKGWMEKFYIKLTASPYNASQSQIFSNFSLSVVLVSGLFSLGRIYALYRFYHAPLDLAFHFQARTVPAVLGTLGYTPVIPDIAPVQGTVVQPEYDLSALYDLEPRLTLCYAEEWYRYPSSFLVPDGVEVAWIRTAFDGMMPRRWEENGLEELSTVRPGRFNGLNRASADAGAYVEPKECDYLVALSAPSVKPDWSKNPEWEIEHCLPFLDAAGTPMWARLVDVPRVQGLDAARSWGKMCILRRKGTAYPSS